MRLRPVSIFQHQIYPHHLAVELLATGARNIKPWLAFVVGLAVALHSLETTRFTSIAWWFGGVALLALAGSGFRWRYRGLQAASTRAGTLRTAEWIIVCYSLAVGLVWGSISSFLMVEGETRQNVMVLIVYLGFCAGASSMAMFGRTHLLLGGLSSLLVFLLPLHRMFPQDWWWLTLVTMLYGASLLRAALDRHRIIVVSLQLRDEKQRLLEQQRAETARANQANQEKSAFLAAASHDLRQPLHALMLTSHALSMKTPEGENRVLVQRIVEAGQALSYQFNHLMDLSRLESGTYRLNTGVVALQPLLRQILATHRQVAEHKRIRLSLRVDRRLRHAGLRTDAALLNRILDNLTDNAIKFSQGGDHVLITARLREQRILLSVWDQGIGIAPDQQESIFRPYVQLNNPTRELSHGIGLGLSIVREASALLKGRLSLRSRPGAGSCFTLSLDGQLRCEVPSTSASTAPPTPDPLRGKTLLLVEDDAMAAGALVSWAQNWGLEVRHYLDPREVPPSPEPDLILSDIRLPGDRDGIQWMVEWLARWSRTRGLLLSGEISTETDQRAETEGLMLLSKPADPELLLRTLVSMTPPAGDTGKARAAV